MSPQLLQPMFRGATRAARNDLGQDAFNEAVFMRPGQALTRGLVAVDEKVMMVQSVELVRWQLNRAQPYVAHNLDMFVLMQH
jgi:hypothetical protein